MKVANRLAVPSLSKYVAFLAERLLPRVEFLAAVGLFVIALANLTALPGSAGAVIVAAALAYALLLRPLALGSKDSGQRAAKGSFDRDAERQALVEAMPDPAWVLDATGVVLNVNLPARSIFPNLRTGVNAASVVRYPDIVEAVERAMATGISQTAMLHQRVPFERRLAVVVAPLRAGAGEANEPSLMLTLRDLSEQDRLSQMRADFVANASHELRTPLTSLRGFVETLQGPARDDAAARERFLAIMGQQAERMTRLIDDLLSLTHVEMRQHLAPTATVDLVEVAAQAQQGLEPLASKAKIKLALDAEVRPLLIRGDRDELLQVMQNLVQNAIKYGREGGSAVLRLRRREQTAGKPSRVELAVVDDGIGIATEHLPRLTERFYRANTSHSRDKGGTGLGLAIVKHIVGRHGGALLIASKFGEGSTFTVTFDEIGVKAPSAVPK